MPRKHAVKELLEGLRFSLMRNRRLVFSLSDMQSVSVWTVPTLLEIVHTQLHGSWTSDSAWRSIGGEEGLIRTFNSEV